MNKEKEVKQKERETEQKNKKEEKVDKNPESKWQQECKMKKRRRRMNKDE